MLLNEIQVMEVSLFHFHFKNEDKIRENNLQILMSRIIKLI